MDIDQIIRQYEGDIIRASHWYHGLWGRPIECDISDLQNAGRFGIWEVSEKRPEMLKYPPYVRGAIRLAMIKRNSELCKRPPKRLHLIRQEDNEVSLIDTLPANGATGQEVEQWDDIEYYLRHEFSSGAAESLLRVAEKCEAVFDVNLAAPPQTDFKDRVKIVTAMDLSDEDMITYACILTGAEKGFPLGTVRGHPEKAAKYIRFLLNHLGMTPVEFAQDKNKFRILRKYEIHYVFSRTYGNSIERMFADIFPEVEPYKIVTEKRWIGIDGMVNASNAVSEVVRQTRKEPREVTHKDFVDHGYAGMIKGLFSDRAYKAIEFRYPGTFPEHHDEMEELRKRMMRA